MNLRPTSRKKKDYWNRRCWFLSNELALYCRQYKLEMIVHKSIRIIRKRFIPLYCWRDKKLSRAYCQWMERVCWTGARFWKSFFGQSPSTGRWKWQHVWNEKSNTLKPGPRVKTQKFASTLYTSTGLLRTTRAKKLQNIKKRLARS